MHNISSQLYNYVGKLIIDYFQKQNIQPGDRFNLYLEENEQIKSLYDALNENSQFSNGVFEYIHPDGGITYTTFFILIGKVKLIVASSTDASEDYFTMLRNKVAEQAGIFENTAILILFSGKLDSLLRGSGSLIKEGMPLHYSKFKATLEIDIKNHTGLKPFEKDILKAVLERKTKSVVEDNNSFFDYEQVVNSLEKGNIEDGDYCKLGLFKYQELSSKGNAIKSDIAQNFQLFGEFENIFLNGSPEIDLREKVSESAYNKLVNADWTSFDYADISKWIEEEKKKVPPKLIDVSSLSNSQTIWFKPDGDSVARKRNANIIVFDPEADDSFKISVQFDQVIKREGLTLPQGSNFKASISGSVLTLEVGDTKNINLFNLVEYKDSGTAKKFLIKILYLNFFPTILNRFSAYFQLKVSKGNSYLLIKEAPLLIFNEGRETVNEGLLDNNMTYFLDTASTLIIKNEYTQNQEDLTQFSIQIDSTVVPIAVKSDFEAPKPISGLEVWKEKRVHQTDYRFDYYEDVIKLVFRNTEKTVSSDFRHNLLLENQIIHSEFYSWFSSADLTLSENQQDIDEGLAKAFNDYRSYFIKVNSLPSLAHFSDELTELGIIYVDCFINQLNKLQENQPLSRAQKSLMWLGVVQEMYGDRKIKFSPLHPLNVAYQLLVNDKLGNDDVYNAILKRLNPINIVPYIQDINENIYVPIDAYHSPEWLYYSIYLDSKNAIPRSFVSDLIADKIKDYTNNFDFLFTQSSASPIKVNVINLGECKEVVQGIFEYYKKYLNRTSGTRPNELPPIEVNIYGSEQLVTTFEELTFYEKVEDVEKELDIDLRTHNFDKEDLLNAFFDKVNFYSKKFPSTNADYEYCHIAFYQFDISKTKVSYNKMDLVKTGLSLEGLMADVPSTPVVDHYRTGFGAQNLERTQSQLSELACLLNAYLSVSSNDDNYEKNKVLCTTINKDVKDDLEKLYRMSQWVTYIDPKVDLDFFKENKDLVIVHYSDQYTNSNNYDAITVSGKTDQYQFVVKEFLNAHRVPFNSNDTAGIINFFNAVNGEWLLKLIRQDSHFPKEKISLLSGIKSALTFLYHPEIIWIPISLEEILRVSGNVGLTMGDGLFSAKNLGAFGTHSDDLLLIGLGMLDNELQMYFYPIELKIGGAGLVKKGIQQLEKTSVLLEENLNKEGFLGKFYRNFFAKIAMVSAAKMRLFHIWDSQNWSLIEEFSGKLQNDDFKISNRLEAYIGKYGLIYFGNDTISREIKLTDNLLQVNLVEDDGYNFLVKSIDELIELFHNTPTTVASNRLLVNAMNLSPSLEKLGDITDKEEDNIVDFNVELPEKQTPPSTSKTQEGIKILFGSDLNNFTPVIWEPNNTNKIMHTNTGIIGTMGTGKTQFTKSLITQLYQKSNDNIGNNKLGILIFDYKGDYIKDDFVSMTNALILNPHKLPYNPLALDASDSSKAMLPLHTANDIKETIANAFNLGNVQRQKLRDIIIAAYDRMGINKSDRATWSKTAPTLGTVCDLFLEDESISQDSLYAAISNLSDFEIFESDPTKTQSLYSLIEGVVVINLSGYDESIQNLIVAITLDAFYTQMQKHGHSAIKGHYREITKMILVDEADNFLSKNFASIRKILKEGREFGVGTILSTQFLNHFATSENEYSNYILTWVIHRVNEIKIKEVDSLFSLESKTQRENLIKKIKGLEKHQSIVNLAGSEPILIKDKAFWELIE